MRRRKDDLHARVNRNLAFQFTDTKLTSYAGLELFDRYLRKIRFSDLVRWVEQGNKPVGDDVFTPSIVAHPAYGCAFTNNTLGADDTPGVRTARAAGKLPACPTP